jgi:hypothetical protein
MITTLKDWRIFEKKQDKKKESVESIFDLSFKSM